MGDWPYSSFGEYTGDLDFQLCNTELTEEVFKMKNHELVNMLLEEEFKVFRLPWLNPKNMKRKETLKKYFRGSF